MAEKTKYLGLILPTGSERVDIGVLNENAVAIDNAIGKIESTAANCAAPMQDATVEGQWMKFAEYSFPAAANFESTDLTLLVRNRVLTTTKFDGILRVRCRYAVNAAEFHVAQIYWILNSGIAPEDFVLCHNAAEKKVELYVRNDATYEGCVFKCLDMGASTAPVDFTAWALHSPTMGQAELPSESDGWKSVISE